MDYILTTNAVSKKYWKAKALDGVTMHIPRGAIYGFVGRNGAGKTTLIRLICGLQDPSEGDYTLCGINSASGDIAAARRKMSAVVEKPAFYSDMTARQNLEMQYTLLGMPADDGIDELLKLVGLSDTGSKKAKNFSLGMKQRLGIAIALCGRPDFLVLDEPTNGLDPQGIIEIRELILRLNRERQMTVLISSHILDELARLATHYGFIEKGKIVQEISAQALEAKCRKYLHVKVSDIKRFTNVMEENHWDYEILTDSEANIYEKIMIRHLSDALAAADCELMSVSEHEESLENYFINLIGGAGTEGGAAK
ncbi:MAG: ATP-binding cassette domain-containing protein [Oscillospiraceae bacterium]|nr:ATP-binding cassette domain-containing protein [Oscillospiraceae bacterium]